MRAAWETRGFTGRLPVAVVDLAPAVVLLAAMVAVRLGGERVPGRPLPLVLGLCVVIAGSLAFRRRTPLAAYAVGTAGLSAEALWADPGGLTPIANLIGLYSLGLYASPARARLGALLVPPGVLAFFAPEDDSSMAPAGVLFVWLLVWAAGYGTARRRRALEARRRLKRREAVINERVRIARELHDVVGHAVNAMLVQAGAGRMVLATEPERTRELLMSVERTGREALAELDRLLGVLRAEDGTPPGSGAVGADEVDDGPGRFGAMGVGDVHGGPPGLDELEGLVRPLADAGMAVRVRVESGVRTRTLSREMETAVHRIVQEALTNALRHGRARSADVTVQRTDGTEAAVLVNVVDDGDGPASEYRLGRGLLGITERAGVFGGSVRHGRASGGGFALRVELPMP
ncbi:sensor histidine kinase [Streptomyces sp. DSM 40750]|uniref:sensor histidine kinase n=1 Tax=Streptomyces sp. DSM 40750 TaxID=2801030 RepID=UPI00214AC7ED|nr:histidine kinase [Streptomyces sp. DSM 40750]UUU25833.1 histidine kinase [Streptomyces sp. DSM 40750]